MDALHLFEILRECMEATRDLVAACAVEVRAGLRPSRHVRGADREHLSRALCQVVRDVFDRAPARSLWRTSGWLSQAARALHTRPSVVRRLLLGRPVSARAAARVLSRI